MHKTNFLSLFCLTFILSGCFSGTTPYEGLSFPKTTASEITFQESSVPPDCSAFAHLLMKTKMNSTGKDISLAMRQEAEAKGAHLILVGLSREMQDEELSTDRFDYYGPQYAYSFNKTWLGWKFGFDEWNDAGNLIGIGATTMEDGGISFDNTLLIQAVFLRCGEK